MIEFNKENFIEIIKSNVNLKKTIESSKIHSLYSEYHNCCPWGVVLDNFPGISRNGIPDDCSIRCHECKDIFWENVKEYLDDKYDNLLKEMLGDNNV